MMPKAMQTFLASCSDSETGQVIRLLSELTNRSGFDSALNTIDHAIACQVKDADSLASLYRRLYADIPELPAMNLQPGIPQMQPLMPNLTAYDRLLNQKEVNPHV
jgi:hypothetical protein